MAIYYVEDDRNIRDLVVYSLRQSGFDAEGFTDAEDFRKRAETGAELLLLDVMLPGKDGVTLLAELKKQADWASVPVIMVTARGAEYDRVLGLNVGADDYIVKPFGVMELIARVRAVLRRCRAGGGENDLCVGDISVNNERHRVLAGGREVALTFKEYELLRFLMEHADAVCEREQLLNAVWGFDYFGGSRTVDVHIQTLRQKLGDCASQIETIRGLGYRIRGSK